MLKRHLSTTVPFGFSFDPELFLRAYQRAGCTHAQYYRNPDNQPPLRDVIRTASRIGMPFDSIHGIFGPMLDPSCPDPGHRRACLQVYRQEGLLALELGCSLVVVHPAANRPDHRLAPRAEADAIQRGRWHHFDDFAHRLAEIGESLGVTYLIENVPTNCHLGHDAAELARRILALGTPRLRMCFDTGHGHLMGDVAVLLRECAPAVSYLHVNDNRRTGDDHLMPGDGTIEWQAVAHTLAECRLNIPCMVEVFYPEAEVERLATHGNLRGRLADCCAIGRDTLAPA